MPTVLAGICNFTLYAPPPDGPLQVFVLGKLDGFVFSPLSPPRTICTSLCVSVGCQVADHCTGDKHCDVNALMLNCNVSASFLHALQLILQTIIAGMAKSISEMPQ